MQNGKPRAGTFMRTRTAEPVRGRVIDLGEAYWREKAEARGALPSREALEPADIPLLLPQVVLIDVGRAPWDFRFRLIGTNVVFHLEHDLTGRSMSDIPHMRPPSRIFDACVRVATSGEPFRSDVPYVGPHRAHLRCEDVILPLARDGRTVDRLLIFIECFDL